MHRMAMIGLGLTLVTAGCVDPEMEQRLADAEQKLQDLEKDIASSGGGGGGARVNQEKEEGAKQAVEEINNLIASLQIDEAKQKIASAEKEFAGTRTVSRLGRTKTELAVVGTEAGELDVEKWYQGNAHMDDGSATLMIFWESWCPHCKREVPKLEAMHNKYKDRGLNLIGLTKVTKSATDESVQSFIDEKELTYPVAKEKDGNLSTRFGVRGVPAAAIVKDGKVVWRGHPARLTDTTIEKVL